jgi:hypothetical protein
MKKRELNSPQSEPEHRNSRCEGRYGRTSIEHRDLLDKRLQRIEKGETTFKNWDSIKVKYENKAV